METTRACNKNEPSVHVFFLAAEEVNPVSIDITHERSDIPKRASLSECTFCREDYFLSVGTIKGIRTMHKFQAKPNRSIESPLIRIYELSLHFDKLIRVLVLFFCRQLNDLNKKSISVKHAHHST